MYVHEQTLRRQMKPSSSRSADEVKKAEELHSFLFGRARDATTGRVTLVPCRQLARHADDLRLFDGEAIAVVALQLAPNTHVHEARNKQAERHT